MRRRYRCYSLVKVLSSQLVSCWSLPPESPVAMANRLRVYLLTDVTGDTKKARQEPGRIHPLLATFLFYVARSFIFSLLRLYSTCITQRWR